MDSAFTYFRPKTVTEALEIAARLQDGFSYLAGGTDVWVNRVQGTHRSQCIIDLSQIPELQTVTREGNILQIGALVKLDRLGHFPPIAQHAPVLLEAARAVGSPLIRRMATLGGNLLCENRCSFYNHSDFWREAVNNCLKSGGERCIATGGTRACFSEFVSDTAPALIAMDASVEIADINRADMLPLEKIYTGDGLVPHILSKTAILTHIRIPVTSGTRSVFKKLRPRNSMDFTSLTSVVSLYRDGRLKIAISGVHPGPVVLEGSAGYDTVGLIREALKRSKTVDNDYYSRTYRRNMIRVFLNQSFEELGISEPVSPRI